MLGIVFTTVGALAVLASAHRFSVRTQAFGTGLGVTAYMLGVRHAFDADHMAAIDYTTRRFLAEGRPSTSLGFWFALGHSSVVVALSLLPALGARLATRLTDDSSSARLALSVLGTSVSGLFLCVMGVLNLVALRRIAALYRSARRGDHDEERLSRALDDRGLLSRLLRRLTASTTRPWHIFPLGLPFGLGFDTATATEVSLLALSGAGATSGVPWYALMLLPLLFTCGMSLFDTLDGAFMSAAYRWAFVHPLRRIHYNLTTTGLSAAAALMVGAVNLATALSSRMPTVDRVLPWLADIDLNAVGYLIGGLLLVAWISSALYWKVAGSPGRHHGTAGRARRDRGAGRDRAGRTGGLTRSGARGVLPAAVPAGAEVTGANPFAVRPRPKDANREKSRLPSAQPSGLMVPVRATGVPSGNVMRE
ncbi:HoxN/HupN/NixA family nickel/cobalt transporter [Streptomyces sp. NBC_00268]|uniref:HoxN/HupN/NixA family nickel/cobalt transporter n=1 Tax=Streptomyces sp. NBC_00268 TaxID=2975695 RepID=UPI00225701EB|nr:HoxN/HupN/NixA family nickel/cobalt transporter [Streptomyces sp. NBC_00268]MCX5182870.1 HoxN/HupN/NixA family nickel/cobalt transporter [Streptomyces sp. NBC_00268]